MRQLENTIERMIVLAAGDPLGVDHLPPRILAAVRGTVSAHPPSRTDGEAPAAQGPFSAAAWVEQGQSLSDMTEQIEREAIRLALDRSGGRITEAARILGTTRRILRYKMDKLGFEEAG